MGELLRDVKTCRWVSSFAGLLDPEGKGNKSLQTVGAVGAVGAVGVPATQRHGVTAQKT